MGVETDYGAVCARNKKRQKKRKDIKKAMGSGVAQNGGYNICTCGH
jgi:hypothetical protein